MLVQRRTRLDARELKRGILNLIYMKVLQVGSKNYPPAHGGTERVVYNIVNSIDNF